MYNAYTHRLSLYLILWILVSIQSASDWCIHGKSWDQYLMDIKEQSYAFYTHTCTHACMHIHTGGHIPQLLELVISKNPSLCIIFISLLFPIFELFTKKYALCCKQHNIE